MKTILPALLITLILAVLSHELLLTWQNSPYDHFGGFAFIIWFAAPILLRRFTVPKIHWPHTTAAILASIGWALGEFNFVLYVALSLSLFGWIQFGRGAVFWWIASICWMPILGYLLGSSGIDPMTANIGRLALAVIALLALALSRTKPSVEPESST